MSTAIISAQVKDTSVNTFSHNSSHPGPGTVQSSTGGEKRPLEPWLLDTSVREKERLPGFLQKVPACRPDHCSSRADPVLLLACSQVVSKPMLLSMTWTCSISTTGSCTQAAAKAPPRLLHFIKISVKSERHCSRG